MGIEIVQFIGIVLLEASSKRPTETTPAYYAPRSQHQTRLDTSIIQNASEESMDIMQNCDD